MTKTHYFYWGFANSGKGYINRYSKLNSKVLACFFRENIVKTYSKVHIHERLWDDVTFTSKIIHNNNGMKTVSKTERRIYRYIFWATSPSTIHSKYRAFSDKKKQYEKKNMRAYTDEEIKKYSDWKYHDSSVYYAFVYRRNQRVFPDLDLNEVKKNIDEIMEDVDVADSNLMHYYEALKDVCRRKNSVNIIPYKVDLLDSFVSKLDGFANFNQKLEDHNDLFEVYNLDKERVWKWLDYFLQEQNDLIDKFKNDNIPYVFFNLDEDKYSDLFTGWDVDLHQRDCTHHKYNWELADEDEKWKYQKVLEIAKEYMSVRNPKPLQLR